MVCKTCGAIINDGDTICKNCGDIVRVAADKKVSLGKDSSADNGFSRQAEKFGGVIVKERRSRLLSGVDPKMMSIVLVALIFAAFVLVFFVYDRKRTTVKLKGFEVTLPASMRLVDDQSFEVMDSDECKSYANTELEFTYVIYDVETIIPELSNQPATNNVDALMEYYEGKDKLATLESDFTDELNEAFSDQLKDYDLVEKDRGLLKFRYKDTTMTENYVEMHIEVVGEKVYQFSVLCSDGRREKLDKTFSEIYKSLKLDK